MVLWTDWLAWEREGSITNRDDIYWTRSSFFLKHRMAFDYFSTSIMDGERFLTHHSSRVPSYDDFEIAADLARLSLCNLSEPNKFMSHVIWGLMYQIQNKFERHVWERRDPKVRLGSMSDQPYAHYDKYMNQSSRILRELYRKHNISAGASYGFDNWRPKYSLRTSSDFTNGHSEISSVAIICFLYDYVNQQLHGLETRPILDGNDELAVVACLQPLLETAQTCSMERSIDSWNQYDLVVKLVRLGINPNIDMKGMSLWSINA